MIAQVISNNFINIFSTDSPAILCGCGGRVGVVGEWMGKGMGACNSLAPV